MRRFPRIFLALAQTNLAVVSRAVAQLPSCVHQRDRDNSISYTSFQFVLGMLLTNIAGAPPRPVYCLLSFPLPSLTALTTVPSFFLALFRVLMPLVQAKLLGKKAGKQGTMRTRSGRRSYCFKADRFIYCPNNHAEPGLVLHSFPPSPPYGIKLYAAETDVALCVSFARCCYAGLYVSRDSSGGA